MADKYDRLPNDDGGHSDLDPSKTGPGTKASSIEKFLKYNTQLDEIKARRDGVIGWMKFVNVAVFGFLLFSPALTLIPKMKLKWVVAVLWTIIGLILWTYLEYQARSEIWFICLCRGIIVDFHKTDSAVRWVCQKPMFFAYVFIIIFVVVTYVGLDPHLEIVAHFESHETDLASAIMAGVGLLFVIFMSKSVVDLEGSNWLLTPNLMIAYFKDPELLAAKGFKVVHLSQLKKLVGGISMGEIGSLANSVTGELTFGLVDGSSASASEDQFSWNNVHALSHVADESIWFNLVDGFRISHALRAYKDLDR